MDEEISTNNNRVKVKNEGIILEKTDLPFENHSVLNPACVLVGDTTHMLYRAVRHEQVKSTLGYCRFKNHTAVKRYKYPVLFPECEYDQRGVEDPRIVLIDDIYYLTYTAYDGKTASMSYAVSTELPHFTKRGFLFPKILFKEVRSILRGTECGKLYLDFKERYIGKRLQDNDPMWLKNIVLFPRKINGKFALLYRILPGMHIAYCDDLHELTVDYWKDNLYHLEDHVLFYPKFSYEMHHVAAGCPPIETKDGWLMIYHSVQNGKGKLVYHACAALLDLDNPQKVISRLHYPLFSPTEDWEKFGVVNNVVFPSGAVVRGDLLYIYYGAADAVVGAKSLKISELLAALKKS
jgi:predicted GH43/DUF377 family glycosyl hydrolase